jgi:hypothetical protein
LLDRVGQDGRGLEIEKFNRAVKDFSTQRNAKEAMMKNEKEDGRDEP